MGLSAAVSLLRLPSWEARKPGFKPTSSGFSADVSFSPCLAVSLGVDLYTSLFPDVLWLKERSGGTLQSKGGRGCLCLSAKAETRAWPRRCYFCFIFFFHCCSEFLFLPTPPKVSNRCENTTELKPQPWLMIHSLGWGKMMQEIAMVMPVGRHQSWAKMEWMHPWACREAQNSCCLASEGDRAETVLFGSWGQPSY